MRQLRGFMKKNEIIKSVHQASLVILFLYILLSVLFKKHIDSKFYSLLGILGIIILVTMVSTWIYIIHLKHKK